MPQPWTPGTMLEINGNPNRRDLSEHHARLAAEAGVTICVNTDAHGVDTLDNMTYGIATARRGLAAGERRRQHARLARVLEAPQGLTQARILRYAN